MIKYKNCFSSNAELKIIEDKDEGGFVAFYPDLPGCITCGETIESVLSNAIDAKNEWLKAVAEM